MVLAAFGTIACPPWLVKAKIAKPRAISNVRQAAVKED